MVTRTGRQWVETRFLIWLIWPALGIFVVALVFLFLQTSGYSRPKVLTLVGLAVDMVGVLLVALPPILSVFAFERGRIREAALPVEEAMLDSRKVLIGLLFVFAGFAFQFVGGIDYELPVPIAPVHDLSEIPGGNQDEGDAGLDAPFLEAAPMEIPEEDVRE